MHWIALGLKPKTNFSVCPMLFPRLAKLGRSLLSFHKAMLVFMEYFPVVNKGSRYWKQRVFIGHHLPFLTCRNQIRHMSTEATWQRISFWCTTAGFTWGAMVLVNNDNLRQVINEWNPSINFALFHAKSQKCYLRYLRWRVLKNLVRSETTPHKGVLNAWDFSSLNGGTYINPVMIDALKSL